MPFEKLNKVLCINDNEISSFILRHTLNHASFANEVICLKDGSEAENYLDSILEKESNASEFPALLFLDLHMPVMDGWEFLELFAAKFSPRMNGTKIVITSHSVDSNDNQKISKYPFVIDFMNKGINPDYLDDLRNRLANFSSDFTTPSPFLARAR